MRSCVRALAAGTDAAAGIDAIDIDAPEGDWWEGLRHRRTVATAGADDGSASGSGIEGQGGTRATGVDSSPRRPIPSRLPAM